MIYNAIVITVLLFLPSAALGQDADCAPEVELRRAPLTHEGQPGVWFAMPVARCLLGDVQELPLLHQRISLLEEKLTLRTEQKALLEESVELGRQAEHRLEQALQSAEERAAAAEERMNRWTRSPWFLIGTGVVLTVVVEVAAVAILRRIE